MELAHLVQAQRALLILDGLEPLQYVARGSGRMDDAKVGGVKDPGIKALLSLLADYNPGLCLITTRIKLAELAGNTGVVSEPLDRLSLMAGIELLRDLGAEPKMPPAQFALPQRAEFAALVPPYAPPLEYTPPPADARAAMPPRIAKDLIGAVEETEKPAETVAGRELALLFFLGLFDRPAEMAHLPVVFPQDAAQVLQPDAADLPLAAKDLIPIEKKLHELKTELEAGVPPWRAREIAREEAALKAEWAEAHEAARRLLLRRAFAGMAEAARDRRLLTEPLHELTRRGLVSKFSENAGFDKASVDCHPLVREYFGARLKELDRETFKAAHGRLYDHYRYAGLPATFRDPVAYGVLALKAAFERDHYTYIKQRLIAGDMPNGEREQLPPSIGFLPSKQLQNAFELVEGTQWKAAKAAFLPKDEARMTPLFAAIAHGCAAEREDETFAEVYWPRIARGNESFATNTLGLYGQELAALAAFFETPFTKPSPHLLPGGQALALNLAGFRLRALGRLEDATEPMRATANMASTQGDFENAASGFGTLSELLLTIGLIAGEDGAVAAAERAVTFADRSGDAFQRMAMRTTHADALAQAGRLARSEALFREAEALQKERRPNLPRLTSLGNFRYCDLLLARGRAAESAARAAWALEQYNAHRYDRILDPALDTLTQVRAALAEAPLSASASAHCAELSKDALAALRRANVEEFQLRGLLAHAETLWRCGDAKAADEPLREAETIAARGPMPLFMTDAHLLRARIALSQNNLADSKRKRDAALDLIAKHGYGRAAPEAAMLKAEIACAENAANREAAIDAAFTAIRGEPCHDERAGITIDGGWWGLLPRLELLLSPGDPRLAGLRAAHDAYNAERDAYLRSTLAKDAKDYHPANDAIAAYLGVDVWAEEDRALADPDFRRELSEALVRSGYKPLDETPIAEQRNDAQNYLRLKRKSQSEKETPDLPEIPDELLDQILADATACEAIETMLGNAGVKEPLKSLPRETQRQAVAVFLATLVAIRAK